MERTSKPDQYSDAIKRLRQLRDEGLISRHFVGYFLWYVWERRHGRV